ncbi:MAG TPA: hypothetical protein VIG50_07915, partial [Vicinamibacteria bacterium]
MDLLGRVRSWNRSQRLGLAGIAGLLALLVALAVAAGQDPQRRRGPLPAASPMVGVAAAAGPDLVERPAEEWTPRFRELLAGGHYEALDDELTRLREQRRDVYDAHALGYLHARAKIERDDLKAARELLQPHAPPGQPLRDLALHYLAEIAHEEDELEEASRLRQQLIFDHPRATYRSAAIADESAYLGDHGDAARLGVFLVRLAPTVEPSTRRLVEARLVERLAEEGDHDGARERGLRLLRDHGTDDAADRVFRVLDDPRFLDAMGPAEWVLLGESARSHRHFDRAIPLLERAMAALPSQREDLLFSIGRAHFGQEDYVAAEKTYLAGVDAADDVDARVNFLYHAARSAQLRGDDATGEAHLTRAIGLARPPAPPRRRGRRAAAAPSEPHRSAVVYTQRLRLRLGNQRWREAEQDLRAIQRHFARTQAVRDAAFAYAAAMIEAGRAEAGRRELDGLRAMKLGDMDAAEADYWRARSWERANPHQAVLAYLRVLRAQVPTHFAYFARHRLAQPALAARVLPERQAIARRVEVLRQKGDLAGARRAQTDVVLLTPPAEQAQALARLADVYRQTAGYGEVLALQPEPFPQLPLGEGAGRAELLLAMGLFDDAVDDAAERYPLAPASSALTRSVALNLGAATRESIAAIEVLMRS